ncbi:HAD family hydrolase [Salicibibacter cibarius]|uniref:HAD family hydrolase n=1 Tax=Salicibibacter cibarius TaxID=2743000 RepID=A0A7T7CCX1_9BACI|nr:HAD family hydrolase [Salicibibacter cibarius]QQK77388.1 HAD family hydrolase [Salicibibacter cibarius]
MIFFDIDETLLDHGYAENRGALDFYHQHSYFLNLTAKDFLIKWGESSKAYFQKFLNNEMSFEDQRRMRIKDLFGENLTDTQADQMFSIYLELYKKNWKVFDDVNPGLQDLKQKGYKLGIISNGNYTQQTEKLEKTGVDNYFSHIFTSSEIGVAKPDTKIFLEACYQANCEVDKCYYVGDRLKTDAVASISAGMKGIWLNRKNSISYQDLTVIHSLYDLGEQLM